MIWWSCRNSASSASSLRDSDLSAIHDYEAKVEAEEESERRSMEWDESMRTLDSLRNSCRSDPEQLQKTESRIGSLLNAAI